MLNIIIKAIWFIVIVYFAGTEALKMKKKIKWAFFTLLFISGIIFGLLGCTAITAIMAIYNDINQESNT